MTLLAKPHATIFNDNHEVIQTVQLFLWIVPEGFGLKGILGIINCLLNTVSKQLQASMIIVIQMLILGLPAICLGKQMVGIKGIFIGSALTYALGSLLPLEVNRLVMARLIPDEPS